MRRDERGSGTVLTISIMLATCAALLVGVWVAGWMGSVRRAETSADLAALAGAQAYASGNDACRAARLAAHRNAARLVHCRAEGHPESFLVRVQVESELRPAWGEGARWVGARAVAGTLETG